MGNRSRRAGNRWERDTVKELGGQRQPSSGAFGTQHNDAALQGDVVLEYPWLCRPIILECKYGYGSDKSMRVQREWLVKIREEARNARRYPALALKFRDVTYGDIDSAKMICFNYDVWKEIVNEINLIYNEYLDLIKEDYERENS
jgi:Holliday junction resolvase